MKQFARFFMGLLVAAFMLAGVTANPAMAQDKAKAAKAEAGKPTITALAENDKVKVYTVQYKPGDTNSTIANSTTRAVRALKGGTLLRTYADGKTDKAEWKTGDSRIRGPEGAYTVKNVGKSEMLLYVVQVK